MKKHTKTLLSMLAVLAIIMLISSVALTYWFDSNWVKQKIETLAKDNTGRILVLEGDVHLSVFPWLGLRTGKMTLTNAPGFEQPLFAEAKAVAIKVKLLPLFYKKLDISQIVVKGLVLNLAKNRQGLTNWADLIKAQQATAQPSTQAPTTVSTAEAYQLLGIGGISFENATINWNDQAQPQRLTLTAVNFKSTAFTLGKPFDVSLSVMSDLDGKVLNEALTLDTAVKIEQDFSYITLSQLLLKSETQRQDKPKLSTTMQIAKLGVDVSRESARLDGLALKVANLVMLADMNGSEIGHQPKFAGKVSIAEFNGAELMRELGVPLPIMQDSNALSLVKLDFDLLATANSIDFQNLLMQIDDSHLNGVLGVSDLAQGVIAFNLAMDTLDLDRYLTPSNANIAAKPIASPIAAAAAGAALIPVEQLKELKLDGQLTLEKLKVNGVNMQKIRLKVDAKDGALVGQQAIADIYQGSSLSDFRVDVHETSPKYTFNGQLQGVQLAPLIKNFKDDLVMTGKANIQAQLQASGKQMTEITSNLNGKLSLQLQDGTIKGFNIQSMIDNGKALVAGAALPTNSKHEQSVFSDINATGVIQQGVLQNNDLVAHSAKVYADGNGRLDLNTQAIDYHIIAKLIKKAATATEPEQIEGIPLAFHIGGTFNKPVYAVDAKHMLTEQGKAKLEEEKNKLLDKLDKKIGPGASDLLKGLFK
ncbi:MAG: AsmA family protein [Methylococcaceae bacterium]|jgi:AsmA protein